MHSPRRRADGPRAARGRSAVPRRPAGGRIREIQTATGEGLMCLGIPGKIVTMHDTQGLTMGVVDFGGVRREVCLAYVADEVKVGDYAVVHVGFAIAKVDEAEAQRTFEVL